MALQLILRASSTMPAGQHGGVWNSLPRLELTFQEPVEHSDVGAKESHRQQVQLIEGARGPVLPDAEGQACLRDAEIPGSEGATSWEGVIDEGEVHSGTAWPMAFALSLRCGPQEDLEEDGEQGEATVCRERRRQPPFRQRMKRRGRRSRAQCGPQASAATWPRGLRVSSPLLRLSSFRFLFKWPLLKEVLRSSG